MALEENAAVSAGSFGGEIVVLVRGGRKGG